MLLFTADMGVVAILAIPVRQNLASWVLYEVSPDHSSSN